MRRTVRSRRRVALAADSVSSSGALLVPVVYIQRERVEAAPQLLKWKCELGCLQPWVAHVKNGHVAVARRLLHREQVES